MLETFLSQQWDESFSEIDQHQALNKLEAGRILFFPSLSFALKSEEQAFLSPCFADPHAKNISYDSKQRRLWGVRNLTDQQHIRLKSMLDRFSQHAAQFIKALFPSYASHLCIARTSFRPVEISNRQTSYRKDDKRLHVDAFPSAPNQGKRILRVFCNINPAVAEGGRVWRIGESFETVAQRFLPKINKPLPGMANLLRFLNITKSYRTLYDHYMLGMHDLMKGDEQYQRKAEQQEVCFPAQSTWIVQTDHVSHAAMRGQHVLEQTFYLPVHAMQSAIKSPLRILEAMLKRPLV